MPNYFSCFILHRPPQGPATGSEYDWHDARKLPLQTLALPAET